MKHYPKTHEDISKPPTKRIIDGIGSSYGSIDDLVLRFRSFLREAHLEIFNILIKQVWLEQKFTFNGSRRGGRSSNGYSPDWAYSYFMKTYVGISQKPFTNGVIFSIIPSYFKDFFPNFSDHDPFEEKEYFKYPYSHITLDHLMFVYQHDERLELLDEAEKRSMNIMDFMNWAANIALSEEKKDGRSKYRLVRSCFMPYLKKNK